MFYSLVLYFNGFSYSTSITELTGYQYTLYPLEIPGAVNPMQVKGVVDASLAAPNAACSVHHFQLINFNP